MASSTVTSTLNSRLLRSADGWVAVTLPRPSDIELLPAWIGADLDGLEAAIATRTCAELVAGAELLGLPVAALGEFTGPTITTTELVRTPGGQRTDLAPVRVLDL